MVNETLDKLKELQEILAEKYNIESELKDIPRSLTTKTEVVNRLKKSFIERNARLEDTKRKIGELRTKMQEAEHDREAYEAKIVDINTQREYEALVKEIRDASEREQNFRKDLQKEEKVLQEIEISIEREEALIHEQEEELKAEQAKIEEEIEKRNLKISDLDKEELSITPEMDEEMIFKFKRIIRSKQGKGIVPLSKGVCSGCNMILPLQFVNDVRSGKGIEFCPYCSMILYYEEVGDDDVLESMVYEDTSGLFDEDELEDDDQFGSDGEFGGDFDDTDSDDFDDEEEDEEEEDEDEEEEDAEEESSDSEDSDDIEDEELDDDSIDEDGDDDIIEEELED